MTVNETIALLSIMRTAYPQFYKGMNSEDEDDIINLWATMFADDNAKIVTEAVKALICTMKFPPTIADVKAKIQEITQPERMTEMEAWAMVRKAIDYYNATENFAKLPPILQKLVGSPNQLREWAVMDKEVVQSVVQSNFMRSFTVRQKQEEARAMLPDSTKALIDGLSKKFSLTSGDGGSDGS